MTLLEGQWKRVSVDLILYFCNREEIRVIYSVFAEIIEIKPKSVGDYLGKPSKWSSWVVRKDTKLPGGKFPVPYPKNFKSSKVIESTEELIEALN
ncbi:MAG: hypothetical protein OXH90_09055 [Paracoccaceae bacterium]|nr:hypothetical protein [Paracoccaceae bacterium]MDE2918208.1 hypothetical protein [Paracoccaceae bacterium]